jgi:hypothetical protein
MSSDAIVTVRMGSQDSAQMHLAEDNDVIQGTHVGSIRSAVLYGC